MACSLQCHLKDEPRWDMLLPCWRQCTCQDNSSCRLRTWCNLDYKCYTAICTALWWLITDEAFGAAYGLRILTELCKSQKMNNLINNLNVFCTSVHGLQIEPLNDQSKIRSQPTEHHVYIGPEYYRVDSFRDYSHGSFLNILKFRHIKKQKGILTCEQAEEHQQVDHHDEAKKHNIDWGRAINVIVKGNWRQDVDIAGIVWHVQMSAVQIIVGRVRPKISVTTKLSRHNIVKSHCDVSLFELSADKRHA